MAKNPRSRLWCITVNNYTDEDFDVWKQFVVGNCKRAILGREKGESGTPHIQGCLVFENARGFNAIKSICPKAHIEKGRNKAASLAYCTKDGDFWDWDPGAYDSCENKLANVQLKPWQQTLWYKCENFRKYRDSILIYYNKKGGAGKTSFARHYVINHPKESIIVSGGSHHIKYGLMAFTDVKENNLKVIFFNCTRDSEIPYDALECALDATWFNTKYEARMVMLKVYPLCVLFTNWRPDRMRLGENKYVIEEL